MNDDEASRTIIEEHSASCPECARELEQFRKFRTLMDAYKHPELGPDEWSRWDNRLERALDSVEEETVRERSPGIRRIHIPAFAAAAAAVFFLGIATGRFLIPQIHQTGQKASMEQTASITLTVAEETRQYLDRTKLVLLSMTHAETTTQDHTRPDIVRMKQIAGELLHETPDLKKKLAYSHSYRLYALLDEMEVILLQIANFDERNSMQELELVQEGVERKGLIFKINLEDIADESNVMSSSSGTPSMDDEDHL